MQAAAVLRRGLSGGSMMTDQIRVLLIQDNPSDVVRLRETLAAVEGGQFEVFHAERLSEAIDELDKQPFEVILLDLSLSDARGLETITRLHQ
ncbi:MAG: response regulator, partial [Candidatus Binatia bacterium]